MGRGLYTTENIKKGEVVMKCPVIPLDDYEFQQQKDTIIELYNFDWKDGSAIALGLGSLFNHNDNPNVTYVNDYKGQSIVFTALCNIRKGSQLFIDYGYDPIISYNEYLLKKSNRKKQDVHNTEEY
jgi:SET domain-containing protein